jgi:hypothetical protein
MRISQSLADDRIAVWLAGTIARHPDRRVLEMKASRQGVPRH